MNRGKKISSILLLLSLLISACGKNDRDVEVNTAGIPENKDSSTGDIKDPVLSVEDTENKTGDDALFIKEIQRIHFENSEEGYRVLNQFYDAMDGRIYLFRVEAPLEDNAETQAAASEKQRICLQIYDSATRETKQHVLMPEITDYEPYWINSAALTSDGEISLRLAVEKDQGTCSIVVKTDLEGTVLEILDPVPDEKEYPWNSDPFSNVRVYHLADGRTVLGTWNDTAQVTVLSWFDGKSTQEIGRLEEGLPSAICCDEKGFLYCIGQADSVFRWNPEENIRDDLFHLYRNGIFTGTDSALFLSGEGEMLLCRMNDDNVEVYVLTDQKPDSGENEIRVGVTWGDNTYSALVLMERMGTYFVHEPGGAPVKMEYAAGNEEDYRNKIFAELTAGSGPDIIVLSPEDFHLLAEKGLALDLSNMIDEEVKSQMIPAVLEMGTVDGKLVGFTPQVEFSSMLTYDGTWTETSWTPTEFMELTESRKDWEPLLGYGRSGASSWSLFYNLFFYAINHSSLLDLEQGISRFDSDEFIRILELCKKFGCNKELTHMESDEMIARLREGKIAAQYVTVYDFLGFSRVMTDYGEECHMVGMPMDAGSGTFVRPYSYFYMAVNANTKHKEEVQNFINYMLSYEQQFTVSGGCSVRLDVLRDSVVMDAGGNYRVRKTNGLGESSFIYLKMYDTNYLKPDETPWLEEFMDFVENCQPEPDIPKAVYNILREELAGYFDGDRSAEETAQIVQNRIQLYLDEQK